MASDLNSSTRVRHLSITVDLEPLWLCSKGCPESLSVGVAGSNVRMESGNNH